MAMLRVFVSLPAEFSALTVKLNVPAIVGVPEIVPLLAKLKPDGRLPLTTVHVIDAVPLALST
jgi:hypothetical protein